MKLDDPAVPLGVELTAWSPFVPGDDVASGMPCAVLEYTLINRTRQSVAYDFSFHLSNLVHASDWRELSSRSEVIPKIGVNFFNIEDPASETFGTAALAAIGHQPRIKAMWFRGGWFNGITALWREVSTETFTTNEGSNPHDTEGRSGGSILFTGGLPPGRRITYLVGDRLALPQLQPAPRRAEAQSPASTGSISWTGVASFLRGAIEGRERSGPHNGQELRRLAQADLILLSSAAIVDAPRVWSMRSAPTSPSSSRRQSCRQENGNVWGWEGCFPDRGFLPWVVHARLQLRPGTRPPFPKLERTLREQELERSMDERGHVYFRAALPDGPVDHDHHAAADGQLGGMMKVYRDWKISGDDAWLRRMYPLVRRSLEYCIRTWDPDERGALFEPHHNTYDIEFWGPDGMCTTIYVGALSAMALMARALGQGDDAARYDKLARAGSEYLDRELWNGDTSRRRS